ncbi:MAG TPA: D-glycerate dehydrogenase [Acidimicrobiia bacterium]|nr:D-glycerate dehydrogenase [Acidimicrobiia bacterium]
MARVLVTHDLPPGGTDPLVAAGHEIVSVDGEQPLTHHKLVAAARDADAIVCLLSDRIDTEVLAAGADGGRLRIVANVAVGYDNIDVTAATERGIAVCNTPGVLDDTTADLALLLILAATRCASDAEADLRAGRWTGWGINEYLGHDVHGAILGLVGLGHIGQAVLRRATGFNMRVVHHTRHDTALPGYIGDLDRLLAQSDIVSLHVPLNEDSIHLIGARELALMKPSAVLVNTSRGPVIDEEALATALEDGTIFAAGLDVFEHEPEVHPRLLAAPRTVLLPHIGSASLATRRRMAEVACDGVVAVLAGERPENLV